MRVDLIIAIVAAGLSIASCATDIATPFAPPTSFDTQNFCDTVDRSNDLVIPQIVTDNLNPNGADVSSDIKAESILIKAAMGVAHSSSDDDDCAQLFAKGEALFQKTLQEFQTNLKTKGGFKPSKNADILAVQTDITRLWREDQSARITYINLKTEDETGAAYWAQRRASAHAVLKDDESQKSIEELMESYDWIDKKRFGASVSAHAWLLVQHADDHPDFQAKALKRMEPYLETGGIKPANYAYLWDRVAVNTGRKQRYGTQPTWECDENKKLTLQPLENPESVNERRAALKMVTVEEGLENMARGVCK